ncbi:ATP-binding protein [[Pantoea] beijingensis]|uniref:ABC-type xenobiotic transporter n=1 Tax=[Pantoea] beijingensis TaxID=1324864 RepID=A0A443IC59_9GAMM|nr:ATP-binding protein [[Pantoea] beijingensis]
MENTFNDVPDNGDTSADLTDWVTAITYIASHYRLDYSSGELLAIARWQWNNPLPVVLKNLARQAGLSGKILAAKDHDISVWRLPLVIQLKDGQIGIIKTFDGVDQIGVSFIHDEGLVNTLSFSQLLPDISRIIAFRPAAAAKDIRADSYLEKYKPDWLRKLVIRDLKPYWHVMLASLLINVLALAGILFSMQVYDRVIPAQSFPTLYVLFIGVLIAVIFSFILRVGRGHVTDILGKQADMRVSDRVFGHALRLRNSAIPRSTGSFISQVRELEQIREMVTSTTVSAIVDMPFFLLFLLMLMIISPQLAWIAPAAALLMIAPGLLLQKKLSHLARQSVHESTLRNAVLVESLQGLEDIKLMQAEDRFQQQWNSYIAVTAQSGVRTRRITQGLISWGMTIQNLVYASVVLVGAPLVINGDMTTGAIVAASLLSSRMIAPMSTLCGVLARWQQVKAAKSGLDSIMKLPVENSREETKVHCAALYGHYRLTAAAFSYHTESSRVPLRVGKLEIKPGERVAVLGRNGAGKSTFLQALAGGMELTEGELLLDDLSLPHIDVADLRRNIGLLTQNARLFHGTLRDNLTLGAPQASDDDIFSVLEVCAAADFVRRLPLGLDHPIMEGGLGLSGGQRQSILLARMLLRDPNIVLLDEPTASLDEHTEQDFLQRLSLWLAGRTLIVATHRAAVLELVDRVLVFKEGNLVMDTPKEKAFNHAEKRARRQEFSNENQSA